MWKELAMIAVLAGIAFGVIGLDKQLDKLNNSVSNVSTQINKCENFCKLR